MINTNKFLGDLWDPLDNILVDTQILKADQEVPPGKLKENRVIYSMISMPGSYERQSINQFDKTIPNDEIIYFTLTLDDSIDVDEAYLIDDTTIIETHDDFFKAVFNDEDIITGGYVDFEEDIMRTTILYPEATISFNSFGPNAINNLQQIREWFNIPNRGDIWLHDNWGCSIMNIGEIENRTAFLETDFEKRYGFDVIVSFKDVVEDVLETIEKVTGRINGIYYEEDI
ncbi:MAG: hypothetical protein K9K76_09760 [Halanaerobiales bacterium]|nr:hypothetical protein [Halanaerobiales bacterium]